MGNTTTKEKESHDGPPPAPNGVSSSDREDIPAHDFPLPKKQFKLLNPQTRAATFDENRMLPDRVVLGQTDFRPLRKSKTFDTRTKRMENPVSVDDVLFRRYFNMKPHRIVNKLQNKFPPLPEISSDKGAVVVVDPFSSGMCVAKEVMDRGYACITVYSDTLEVMKDLLKHVPKEISSRYAATIYHDGSDTTEKSTDTTIEAITSLGWKVVCILAGAETGVQLSDVLSEKMNLQTNGTTMSEARRNKYVMGEAVRTGGLRAVKQCSATKWSQVIEFIENDLKPDPFEVIVKPVQSAGSDDVTLCRSIEEVQEAFGNIQGKINGLGLENKSTLIQEYLRGTEYVVDTVSHNGKHKVVAVWEYDKREVNNSAFVYFGLLLKPVSGKVVESLVSYILQVLDILKVRYGPAHAEVKWVNGEPCLVEVGTRCHGGDGTYVTIVSDCIGYDQISTTVDAYLDPDAFHRLPEKPVELKKYGCEAMLVSYSHGLLESITGLDEVQQMKSYKSELIHVNEKDEVFPTIDMFTTPGSIMMINESEELLMKDYKRIRELEKCGLLELSPCVKETEVKKAVVVVDPFSTGAFVAKHVYDLGFPCICLYSDSFDAMGHVTSLVPEGVELHFEATVAHGGNIRETIERIEKVADAIGSKVSAVMPGAETGVRVADKLTHMMGLKGNDHQHTDARRDKYIMGETLREAGVRAVKQKKATTWSEAKQFVEDLAPSPFEVVLKPLESAGTDDVTLCLSMEEVERTLNSILGKVNGLGIENKAVLLQEYLEGTEYVVDTVSCNGKHKAICLWKYDKRRVNDAAFVYFGVNLVSAEDPKIQHMIDYMFEVLDALGIKNGPAHGEVKYCHGSPVLVEVGSRCHGGEGAWLPIANSCVGYNQVEVSIESYLQPEKFLEYPDKPLKLKSYGCEAMLVSYTEGVLKGYPGLEEIEKFPSFLRKEIYLPPGEKLQKTIDCFTTPGSIILLHEDKEILERDLTRIRELEHRGLYLTENK